MILAFASAFYLVGRNQLQYDKIDKEDGQEPLYSSFMGALEFNYYLCLGEFEFIDGFELGEASNYTFCWILFITASFQLMVHMMNMLIGIMGNTFAGNRQVQKQMQLKGKLKFVVDNWWMNAIGERKYRVKYIIAALLTEDDAEEVENIKLLQMTIDKLKA